jgi:DNA-directed RNA polymerase specialized sigma24 family protein
LSQERPSGGVNLSEFLARVGDLRPELHRYCSRLTGSVIDGEDVVQDSLASAFVALKTLEARGCSASRTTEPSTTCAAAPFARPSLSRLRRRRQIQRLPTPWKA